MRLVVQRVQVQWSKASRGGHGAQLRAAVPDAFMLPDSVVRSDQEVVVHFVDAAESDGFEPRHRIDLRLAVPLVVGSIEIRPASDEGLVVVRPANTKASAGFPSRDRDRTLGQVGAAPWLLRYKANSRHTGDEWWYQQVAVSIAAVESFDAHTLLGKPTVEIDERTSLR